MFTRRAGDLPIVPCGNGVLLPGTFLYRRKFAKHLTMIIQRNNMDTNVGRRRVKLTTTSLLYRCWYMQWLFCWLAKKFPNFILRLNVATFSQKITLINTVSKNLAKTHLKILFRLYFGSFSQRQLQSLLFPKI